jgi:hypothetical protein
MSRRRNPGARTVDPLDQAGAGWDSSFLQYVLDDQSGWAQSVYAEAYSRAARTLTRSLLRVRWGGIERDAGIIPVLFLWRHHLEISLKIIIEEISSYRDQKCPSIATTHDLVYLWGLARKGLAELVLDDPEVKGVERAVKSFAAFDPDSQAFRYPKLQGGTRAAPGLGHVDPRVLDRAMTKVTKWLDLARYALDGLLHEKEQAEQSRYWY